MLSRHLVLVRVAVLFFFISADLVLFFFLSLLIHNNTPLPAPVRFFRRLQPPSIPDARVSIWLVPLPSSLELPVHRHHLIDGPARSARLSSP